jgi:cytochrome b6-f complex iron-sulfur subunit
MRSKLNKIQLWFSRRNFLKFSLSISGVLTLWGITRFLSFRDPRTPKTSIVLDVPEAYSLGSVTPVPEVRAWLIRDDEGLYALSSVCTHLGCLVNFNNNQFECPCHGSKFDVNGNVLNGPALRPLEYVELKLSPENYVVLDTNKRVSSSDRLQISE